MKGYIAISNDNWCNQIMAGKYELAVFWRKRTTFKAIAEGDYFYFLSRKRSDGKRYILGCGIYAGTKVMTPDDAWEAYGIALGCENKIDFLSSIARFYTGKVNLGCIELKNVKFAKEPVELSLCGITFSDGTVSGKTINETDCRAINERLKIVVQK